MLNTIGLEWESHIKSDGSKVATDLVIRNNSPVGNLRTLSLACNFAKLTALPSGPGRQTK